MLISPAPGDDGKAEGSGSDDANNLQETLDWVHALYNTFCKPAQAESRADPEERAKDENLADTKDDTSAASSASNGDDWKPSAEELAAMTDGKTPEEIAEMMANGGPSDWDENMDDAEWIRLWRLHTMICDGILQTHTEVSKWNDADAAGKKEMEDKLGEELSSWV